MRTHIVVMGVSGCGKSTVAAAIRDQLGFVMAEGDDLHPQANIDKMHAGIPLDDADRWPWLKTINAWTREQESQGNSTVVSCSALKRAYRDVLRTNVPTYFIHLSGSSDLIGARMKARTGHFMPVMLLDSQFETLEPLQPDEQGIEIPVDAGVDDVETRAMDAVRAYMAEHA